MDFFIHNKYSKWYFDIINRASNREIEGYTEIHHIIPRSFGGSNDRSNLAKLTAREHFICHRLLVKMTEGLFKTKMIYAIKRMTSRAQFASKWDYKINSRTFEYIRIIHSEVSKNKRHSSETIKKIKEAAKGRVSPIKGKSYDEIYGPERAEQTKKLLSRYSGEKNSRYGAKASEETKLKMKVAHSGVNNSNYKKKWFNDGQKNYFIREEDAKINYVQGRLISWNFKRKCDMQ